MTFALQSADIAEVSCFTKFDEQVGINRWHFNISITAGTATDEDVLNALEPPVRTVYQALLSSVSEFSGIGVVVWRAAVKQTNALYLPSPPASGGVAGDPLPGQVSGLIKKVSNLPGKKAYGRCYIPFPGEADNSVAGRPVAGYVTRLDALADYMFAPGSFVGPNGVFSLASRHKWQVSGPPPLYGFATITQMIARESWATMRSRGDYGAANVLPWE